MVWSGMVLIVFLVPLFIVVVVVLFVLMVHLKLKFCWGTIYFLRLTFTTSILSIGSKQHNNTLSHALFRGYRSAEALTAFICTTSHTRI